MQQVHSKCPWCGGALTSNGDLGGYRGCLGPRCSYGDYATPAEEREASYRDRPRPALTAGKRPPSALRLARVAAALVALLLFACAPDDPRPVLESGACYAARWSTVAAWGQLRSDLPAECFETLLTYRVELVDVVPACGGAAAGSKDGCSFTGGSKRVVYLRRSLNERQRLSVVVHEWAHVLAECAEGDAMGAGGGDHLDPVIWGEVGGRVPDDMPTDSVVGLGRALAAGGPCLED